MDRTTLLFWGSIAAFIVWQVAKSGKADREKAARLRAIEERKARVQTPGTPEWDAKQARLAETAASERAAHDERVAAELEEIENVQRARREGRYVGDWQSCERAAEWIMRDRLGLKRVKLTGAGADGGIDVVADDACAQVKFFAETKKVGRADVQRLRGAAGSRTALFFAFGAEPYARPAIEWATDNNVALFAVDACGEPTALNDVGAALGIATREAAENAETRRAEKSGTQRPGDRCSKCGKGVRVVRYRRADGGSFLGCSAYPACRNARPYRSQRKR